MKRIADEIKFKGRYLTARNATFRTSAGNLKSYEYVSRAGSEKYPAAPPDGVTVMVFSTDMSRVLLMREFRPAVNTWVYNHPSGIVDEGESFEDAARRELKEETGVDVIEILKSMPPSFAAPGLSDQKIAFVAVKASGVPVPSGNPNEPTEPMWADRAMVLDLLTDDTAEIAAMTRLTLTAWLLMP